MIVMEQHPTKINSAENVYSIISTLLKSREEEEQHKEYFYSIGLTSRNKVLYVDLVAMGTVNACYPFVREVLRMALIKNAVSIIVAHNHPSGTVEPSPEDKRFTRDLTSSCNTLGIRLLDHVIAGEETYYSFADSGTL